MQALNENHNKQCGAGPLGEYHCGYVPQYQFSEHRLYGEFEWVLTDALKMHTAGCHAMKVLRRPNTDPAPFVFREFCKNMQTQRNVPHNPQ